MQEKIKEILDQIETVIVGKNAVMERILMAILAGGHVLMEDVPGVGKTTTAMTFARVLGLETRRVQFTSDTMPSDIIGFSVYDKDTGKLVYKPGAVMTNLLLADEINRTSSKTQSAHAIFILLTHHLQTRHETIPVLRLVAINDTLRMSAITCICHGRCHTDLLDVTAQLRSRILLKTVDHLIRYKRLGLKIILRRNVCPVIRHVKRRKVHHRRTCRRTFGIGTIKAHGRLHIVVGNRTHLLILRNRIHRIIQEIVMIFNSELVRRRVKQSPLPANLRALVERTTRSGALSISLPYTTCGAQFATT